jgi:hypothetical protein
LFLFSRLVIDVKYLGMLYYYWIEDMIVAA